MTSAEISKIAERRAEFLRLKDNPYYKDVDFDESNGGLKATHIGHNFDKNCGRYEKCVQTVGYMYGHAVVLENERGGDWYQRFTEGSWDGLKFEISAAETATANNILRGLKHCASKRETEIAVLFFPNGEFSADNFDSALRRYKGLEKLGDGQFLKFQKIICIQEDKIILEIDM